MGEFDNGAAFRVTGAVVRKYVNQALTFAAVTLDVVVGGRSKKVDLRAFARDFPGLVEDINALGAGMTIQVTGSIDVEKLTDRAKNEVKKDGYPVWTNVLTIRNMKVEGSSVQSQPSGAATHTTKPAPPLED